MSSGSIPAPQTLSELEFYLRDLSHNRQATQIIQGFSRSLKNTKERQKIFSQNGALIQAPIFFEDLAPSEATNIQPFQFLNGDIVQTDCAYFLGERLEGLKFIIASSTCDLVPGRRKYLSLLKINQLWKDRSNTKEIIGESLKFASMKRMYLPPFGDDNEAIAANIISFDGIIQIKSEDLLLSRRCASLSLVGWRIFSSLLRDFFVRSGEEEIQLRSIVNAMQQPKLTE